jgi:4-hydroxyproline epimerase
LVLLGGPNLGTGPLGEQVERFREKFDHYRSAIANEPRASDIVVGALLCRPNRPDCQLGVIYFNNVGYLGMCGHGTIGLVTSLAQLGKISPGKTRIDTPVGPVEAELHRNGEVSIENVPSYRKAKNVSVDVPGLGSFHGDVAWGGNWFFLAEHAEVEIKLSNVERLTDVTWRIRQTLNRQGFPEVDHVELFAPSPTGAHRRNFVLCPGKAYDRSPCGTGTSAKLACLAADGKLGEGEEWVQESVLGTRFTGRYRWLDRPKGVIVPTITGRAHITGKATLVLDPADPLCWGIRPG